MKKILFLVLTATLMLSLVACSGDTGTINSGNETASQEAAHTENNTKDNDAPGATIITNEGETVTMTAEELIDAYDSNEVSFNKLYQYAEIQFTGTISNIKVDTSVIVDGSGVKGGQQKIVFEEGWCLVLGKDNQNYDLADFNSGDLVTVTSSIVGAPFDTDFLKTVSDGNRVAWLVGDDEILGQQFSSIPTVIEVAQ